MPRARGEKPNEANTMDHDKALDLYLVGALEIGRSARTHLCWNDGIDEKWWCTLIGCDFYSSRNSGVSFESIPS